MILYYCFYINYGGLCMSKVSVIVPVYNGEDKLKRCVESILNQDYEDLELILVNDGSKDNSRAIIDEYAEKDSRIKKLHKENGGVSSTRNAGLELAEGDYVQFVDVDDYLPMESTKQLVRSLEDDRCDMVISDFYRVVGDNVSLQGSIAKGGVISVTEYADEMLKTPADFYYGVLWNKLYKRSIIEEFHIRLDESVSYCEDVIFNMEYLKHVGNISVLKAPQYYYIKTKGSLVEQNMDLDRIIKMKTTVIKYYDGFYRYVFSEDEYLKRKPLIYSYLIAISTDGFSIPFINSRKIGEESGDKYYSNEKLSNTSILSSYLSDMLVNRYLNTVAQKYRMELNDIKVLYFLWLSDKPCSLEEIAAFTGLSFVSVSAATIRLIAKSYISLRNLSIADTLKDNYTFNAPDFAEEFEQLSLDYYHTCYGGLTPEEVEEYERLQNRINENIRRVMGN